MYFYLLLGLFYLLIISGFLFLFAKKIDRKIKVTVIVTHLVSAILLIIFHVPESEETIFHFILESIFEITFWIILGSMLFDKLIDEIL